MQYTDDYLVFYAAYPRKQGKAEGQKAWRNMTKTDQTAALADVEKRVRQGGFSQNLKLVQLPASYLRSRRWEDDWQATLESSRRGDDEAPVGIGMNPANYKPVDERYDFLQKPSSISEDKAQLNRLWLAFNMVAMRELDSVLALQIRDEVLRECEVLDESPAEQAQIRGELFMDRLDAAYGTTLGSRAMRQAIANRREWRG